jgi:manganese transport protein
MTRLIAIIPALLTIIYFGENATEDLLVLSQVILSLQLGFAAIPLIHFVSDKTTMKEFVIPLYVKLLAWLCALIIVVLNAKLVYDQVIVWLSGPYATVVWFTVVPVAIASAVLLLYITFKPMISKKQLFKSKLPHPVSDIKDLHQSEVKPYKKIAITIDFSTMDNQTINSALAQGGKEAEYLLVHIVESAGAIVLGSDIADFETGFDKTNLNKYINSIKERGYICSAKLGYGNPKRAIPAIVKEYGADLLVMGAHGHKRLKDILFGTTVDAVRHRISIPIFIVRNK